MKGQFEETLRVESAAFLHNGKIPRRHTGYGEDVSPELTLRGLSDAAVSLAIIMNDRSHPIPEYNHWVIWNLPACEVIMEGIPRGATIQELGGAAQGIGYGRHCYRGPKPPFFIRKAHEYQFLVYALDCRLELDCSAKRSDLLQAMKGHILQCGSITGFFQNGKEMG